MKFAASDSVSELVWSEREGLSLKSVYCSKSEKKPVIVWNFGQSSVPLSPSQSVGSTNTDKKQVVNRNFIISCANSNIDGTVDQRAFPSYKDIASPIIGSGHKRSTDNNPKMDKETSKDGDLSSQMGQIDKNLEHIEEKEVSSAANFLEAGIGDGTQGKAVAGHSDQIISLQGGKESKLVVTMPAKLNRGTTSNANYICNDANEGGQILSAVTLKSLLPKSFCKDDHDREAALHVVERRKAKMKLPSLNTLEFSAENDLHLINHVNFLPSEERLMRSSSVPLETSPIIKSQRKGQKKAVSDGNLEGRFINAPDDSYQSEESCNSVRFVSKGKRKFEFQENLMAESKRIKKQVDGISASTSVIGRDSSFLNWIINVVKGSSKANQEGAPSLELSHGHGKAEHGSSLQKPNICSEKHNPTKKSIGFRNVFESLYTSKPKLSEARPAIDRSVECACSGKVNLTNSPEFRIAESCDLNKVSDECILRSSTTVACQSGHIESATNNLGANLEESKVTCISCDGIGGKTTEVESQTPELAGESEDNKSKLISSLWITRFSPQTGSSSLSLDRGKRSNSGVLHTLPEPNCSTKAKCSDTLDNSNKRTSGDSWCEDLQLATKKESCGAVEEIYRHNPQSAVFSQSHAPPAGNFRNSEATAFMFPRRLDALKRLVPSGSKDHGTCLFCGKRLGSTSCCSHVNEAEQECSQRYDNSYNGTEDTIHTLPVPCIRCFQINHLAVSCPVKSSRQKPLQTNVRQWAGQIVKKNMDDCFQGVHYHSSKTFFEGDVEDQLTTENEFFASGGFVSTGTKKQQMNSDKKSSVVHHFLPVHNVNDAQSGDLPREIFDAVKRLQVSRTDMLKLMNARVLLPNIEGFFLRLRLGKWEAGLGGTGYHVACITGKSTKDDQNCLYVDVGGIKCPVGGQHVSNHGFTEEELMTWWGRSMRSGVKIPSKDDLATKIRQRMKLGI